MNIKIRKLTPGLAEDYVHFFDITPHDDRTDKEELPCYCVTWRDDDAYTGNSKHWFKTREERRKRALDFVKNGSIQGYLAYHGDEIVGWCNANANCKKCVDYLRSFWPIDEYDQKVKVKSIFCFVVAPQVQRMGVATRLLDRVCRDAADDGFDFVEAYVNKEFTDTAHELRGPLAMYEKCDFSICARRDDRVVVRKALKV